jgi:hypothetical protein
MSRHSLASPLKRIVFLEFEIAGEASAEILGLFGVNRKQLTKGTGRQRADKGNDAKQKTDQRYQWADDSGVPERSIRAVVPVL